jgi:hypothetical protein
MAFGLDRSLWNKFKWCFRYHRQVGTFPDNHPFQILTFPLFQERFRSLIPSYIRDSSVAVIVYDITSEFAVKKGCAGGS